MTKEVRGDIISYKDFINQALYAPKTGYYTCSKNSVGYSQNADFYTAQSLNTKTFNRLVLSSCLNILQSKDYESYSFIEIGSQATNPLLDKDHPFLDHQIITPGDPIEIPPKAIVFANELLDAQPFHRVVYKKGNWYEMGVRIQPDGTFCDDYLPELSPEIIPIITNIPQKYYDDYIIDLPLPAEHLFDKITSQSWNGLLLIFDYGLAWETILQERPQGTGRAYYKHQISSNLLANPGQLDITCNICWDRLFTILKKNNFSTPALQSQESFFVHNAKKEIEQIITAKLGQLNTEKQSLKELLHPSHMGQKFQVLHAIRTL